MLGLPFVKRSYTKGVPFLLKMEYKMTMGWTSGWSLAVSRGVGGLGLYLTLKGDHTPIQLDDSRLLLYFEISLRTTLSDTFLGRS